MRHVWPLGDGPGAGTELDREALAELYAHPDGRVRVNFVASADGAVTVDGVSGGLEAPGDRVVFGVLRELADVILVGAGSVRAEGYRGARTSPEREARRRVTTVRRIAEVRAISNGSPRRTNHRSTPKVIS